MTISLATVETVLDALPGLSIGLVGDLFLDRYLDIAPGTSERSLETGLEAYQVARVRNAPGALGTVMNNLAALGVGQLRPVTVLGDDGHGYDLRRELAKLPVDTTYILTDAERMTPTYTKPMRPRPAGGWEELHRLDVRTRGPLTQDTSGRVCEAVQAVFAASDGVIVLDQVNEEDWGVVNAQVRDCLRRLSRAAPEKLLFIDSRTRLGRFPFGVLKGNRAEILSAAERSRSDEEAVYQAASTLSRRTGQTVFCTLGEQGILVAHPTPTGTHEPPVLVPGYPVTGAVDIVGAGDAASSGIVSALLSGATPWEAAAMGNLVASITVQQIGTTGSATPRQVLDRWQEVQRDAGPRAP